jgi:hypothetical protein
MGGGVIVLLLAIAMVVGKETTFKGSPSISNEDEVGKRYSFLLCHCWRAQQYSAMVAQKRIDTTWGRVFDAASLGNSWLKSVLIKYS